MGKIIVKNVVKRKPGFLYFIDALGNVCETPMARKGRSKKKVALTKKKTVKKVTKKTVKKKPAKKKK